MKKVLLAYKKRFAFNKNNCVYKEKGFAHTEKRFSCKHRTDPRQIATANSCGKFRPQFSTAKSYSK